MRKIILASALLLAACAADPTEQYAEAQQAFAKHDFARARVLIAASLEADPRNAEKLLLQARTLLALGDGDGAGTALNKLAALGDRPGLQELTAEAAILRNVPDQAEAALTGLTSSEADRLRGVVALMRGDSGKASTLFAQAVAAGDNVRAFADLARLRLIEKDVGGAEGLLGQADALQKDAIDTLLVRGQAALLKGDLKAALDTYTYAVRLYPANLAALIGKAAALGDLGRHKEMLEVADQAASAAPRNQQVAYLQARAALALKDWDGVRRQVQPLEADLAPLDPIRPIYAEALIRLGQSELASAQLVPFVRAEPANRKLAALLAEARLASKDAAGAVAVLRPIADSPQARPEELALMARAAKAAGDPRAADYERRSRMPVPQVLGADLAEADAAIGRGDWAKAAVAYDRIIAATDGRNLLVLNNMAYAQSMLGNHGKAREFADQALKLAPNNPSVLDTAGWVRFRAGQDLDEARRLLRRAAEQAPGNKVIQMHLAEASRTQG